MILNLLTYACCYSVPKIIIFADHLCDKNNPESNQETCSGYVVQDIVESVYKSNSDWCTNSCVPLPQCYPQCYPYYITYDISPSPGSESSGAGTFLKILFH